MKYLVATLFALLLYLPFMAHSQGVPLTLDEAIVVALSDNPSLEANRYAREAAKRMRQATIGMRAPAINIGGNYTLAAKDISIDLDPLQRDVTTAFENVLTESVVAGIISPDMATSIEGLLAPLGRIDLDLTLQKRNFAVVGGEITMPIWLGGKLNVASRSARINEESVAAEGVEKRNSLITEVVERYYSLALAMESIEVLNEVVGGVKRHLADAEALVDEGVLARSELLYIEYRCAEAERKLQTAKIEAQTLSRALCNSMGGDSAEFIPVTPMFLLDEYEDVEYFKMVALEVNPLLVRASLMEKLAKEGVRLGRSEFLPQVVAMGGASFYDHNLTKLLPRWAIGVGVNFKLFDGLNREYRLSAAKQTLRQASSLGESARRDIELLVEKLYGILTAQHYQVEALNKSIIFARSYLANRQAAFNAGMATSTEVIDAEINLSRAKIERLEAVCKFDITFARLLEAAGVSDKLSEYICSPQAEMITINSNK